MLIALFCVFGMVVGQIFFKMSANALSITGTFFSPRVIVSLLSAMFIYGVTSIAWVWTLQRVELGRVYPLMALAFVLVPIGSHLAFGERFNTQYFLGVAIIVVGILVATKA